jgi:hypothetical protein
MSDMDVFDSLLLFRRKQKVLQGEQQRNTHPWPVLEGFN